MKTTPTTPDYPIVRVSTPEGHFLFRGFPTNRLGATAQILSKDELEALLATYPSCRRLLLPGQDKPQHPSAGISKTAHTPQAEATTDAPANSQYPHPSHRSVGCPHPPDVLGAISILLGCSRSMATSLLCEGAVIALPLTIGKIPASSEVPAPSAEPSNAGGPAQ